MEGKSLKTRLRSLFKWLLPGKSGRGRPALCGESQLEEYEQVYRRAQSVSQANGFTLDDFVYLTDKFWDFHLDKTVAESIPVHILITIQYNLALGTILQAVGSKDERYQSLLKKILAFEVSAQFMLTEVDHGLDAKNLETTATLQTDGSFVLNTPHPGAAKFMPPSMPVAGLPRVAVVMAKLIVKEEDRGIRPFLVALSDEKEMCKGVSTKLIPPLGGGDSLDHAITSFYNVHLPPSALLGDVKPPKNHQEHFFSIISRVPIGTLSLSIGLLPAQKASTVIYAQYSMKRLITDQTGHKIPILSFRTQQLPLARSLAQIKVLEKMAPWVIERFRDPTRDARVRHGLAIITKAVFIQHGQRTLAQFVERCGVQGLFSHNQLVSYQSQMRWVSISEGDTLALSIRLATELLLGKYTLPPPTMPECLLAKHEQGLIAEARAQLQTLKGGHRSKDYNDLMLPRCRPIVEAIGHRVAYEAASAAGVPECLLSVYESEVINMDIGWYIENGEQTRSSLWDKEKAAVDGVLALAETMVREMGTGIRTTAPIVSDEQHSAFVQSLPTLTGEADYSLQTE